jgi:hypothetical protein
MLKIAEKSGVITNDGKAVIEGVPTSNNTGGLEPPALFNGAGKK